MSATSGPYGLAPISDNVGQPRPMRMPNFVASGYANNIFYQQPFYIDPATGQFVPVTSGDDTIYGVFGGCAYTPLGGQPTTNPCWPGGTVIDPTNDFWAFYWPAWLPSTRWQVQANGPVTQVAMGAQFNLASFTAGNLNTGLSQCAAAATPLAVGLSGQVTLIEFATGINQEAGDAFTDMIVGISKQQVIVGRPTSIG